MKLTPVLLISSFLLAAGVALADAPPLVMPAGYRGWHHAKSMVIPDQKHALYGFHHVYVAPQSLAAYQAGKTHPEGSELVVPFYEVVDKDGTINQGALKMVAVMKKEKSAKATGGWRYGAFDGTGNPLAIDVVTGCYNCHASQKARDFVFSSYQ